MKSGKVAMIDMLDWAWNPKIQLLGCLVLLAPVDCRISPTFFMDWD